MVHVDEHEVPELLYYVIGQWPNYTRLVLPTCIQFTVSSSLVYKSIPVITYTINIAYLM